MIAAALRGTCLAFALSAIAFSAISWAASAYAFDARSLNGWWLSIDDTFPKLWDAGVAPTEEVLVINPDGRFEDRAMNFLPGTAQVCAQRRVCADMVVIAYGRLLFAGDRFSIGERGTPPNRLDTQKTDPLIRRVAMSTTTQWSVSADGGLLTLRSGATTRLFARIEPRRLKRLRAGIRASGLPLQKHWRCFLANATASQPSFAALRTDQTGSVGGAGKSTGIFTLPNLFGQARGDGPASPGSVAAPSRAPADFLDRYIKVASYLMTLDAMIKFPIMDDPVSRPFIGSEPEQLLVEEFPGVTPPATAADVQRLKAQVAAIEGRVREKLKEFSGGGPASAGGARGGMSDADISAFALAASEDPEAKRMFCRE